jgi:UDP-N-acetylmuramoyl-L-alanyl-D-glutamate--2,6-diaminopimelate ligase
VSASTHLRPQAPCVRTLEHLARVAGAEQPAPDWRGVEVSGVTHDSRQVRPGDLYAGMSGETVHGVTFAADARAAGAVALLTDRLGRERGLASGLPLLVVHDPRAVLGGLAADLYGQPSRHMLMLGVTGTNGKTTTAYLLEAGLRAGGFHTGLLGTVETRIGDEAIPSVRTTPEAPELHALLGVMRERKVGAVAMEVSSHALAMHRVDGVVYSVALFTNLSHDHLDFHFTLEAYFEAKAALFTPAHARTGVVNIDDPFGQRLVRAAKIPLTTCSVAGASHADWRAADVVLGPTGATFTAVSSAGATAPVVVSMPGDFNVANALGAIVALVEAGVSLEDAARGVSGCPGVPGRMERVDEGQDYLALVDYAHTPDAITRLLNTLRPVTEGRLMIVLGAGGDRDRAKRPLMGEAAARLADVVVLTDDNPRSEDPAAIMLALRTGAARVLGAEAGAVLIEHDRAAAIRILVAGARPGDTIVVAGKGHEQGQELAGKIHPFDDRVQLAAAIREAQA